MLIIFQKIIPLYALVIAGWFAGRFLSVPKESIAKLLIYFITPTVFIAAVIKTPYEPQYFILPVFFYILCVLFCISGYHLAGLFFPSPAKNILGFSAGNANSGYFAVPVALSLFGESSLTPVILIGIGFILCENTVGYYLVARGHYSVSDSFKRLIKLPTVYAFCAGLVLNLSGVQLSPVIEELVVNIRGAYSVLGMMLIGIAIADVTSWKFDFKFSAFALLVKFALWPIVIGVILYVDAIFFHIFPIELRRIIFFMSTVPLAANAVAFAALLDAEPDKAAIAVLLSTLIAAILVPVLN